MNERTAEEKLRQTLEGDIPGDTAKRTPKRVVVRRAKKLEPVAKVADSFMEDFERKIEQSLTLNGGSSKSETKIATKKSAPRLIRKSKAVAPVTPTVIKHEVTIDTPVKPVEITEKEKSKSAALKPKPKPVKTKISKPAQKPVELLEEIKIQEVPVSEPAPEIIKTQATPEPIEIVATPEPEPEIIEPEPEIIEPTPEPVELETEPELEESQPEIIETPPEPIEEIQEEEIVEEEIPEPEPEPEPLPTIEAQIEAVTSEPEAPPTIELPEIPLISENDEIEITPSQDAIDNEENFADESQDALPEIPVISAEDEEIEEKDEVEEEEYKEEENEEEIEEVEDESEELESEIDSQELEEPEAFSPSADLVLNVAEEIPEQPEANSEGESVPVSVEMPETTKTAEDKLMADIAEAMTGSPVSLETQEPLEPSKISEEILNEDPEKQSAENKLLANIAQAMSESPMAAADNNNVRNFEDELENLSEKLSSVFPGREEPLTEEIDLSAYEADEPETLEVTPEVSEPESEKPETEIESTFDEVPLPEPVDEGEPEPAEEPEEIIDAPIEAEAEIKETQPPHEEVKTGIEEPEILEEKVSEPEIESQSQDLPELEEIKTDIDEDDDGSLFDGMPAELLEAMSLPTSESESESEDNASLTPLEESQTQEINSYSLHKNRNHTEPTQEITSENISDGSLLSGLNVGTGENSPESDFDDDDFMGSLGESFAGALSSFQDDEPEQDYGQQNNFMVSQPDVSFSAPAINGFGEEEESQKVEDLRTRLSKTKAEAIEAQALEANDYIERESKSSSSGFLRSLLLAALLGIGGFTAWQFALLNNNLTGGATSNFSSSLAGINPSYEYAVDFIFDSNLSGRMAQRGKDGWQIVGSRKTQDSITGQSGYELIFLREIPK